MTSYKDAGVDIESKENAIKEIRESVKATFTEDVLSAATTFKFGGTISLKRFMQYKEPVLVLSTDGVGTKMAVAEMMNRFSTVGVDILNHSINDVLTSGAKAMFFLDYIAAAKLDVSIVKEIVKGIAEACKRHGIVLAGGETAEMPGMYSEGKYEVTGTIGGIAERENIIDGSKIREGDILLGLASSGLHTNGYSLARKILFEDRRLSVEDEIPTGGKLGELLLATHKEYATSVLPMVEKKLLNGIAHITGGGIPGNLPRILPPGLGAKIKQSWSVPEIFRFIQQQGDVTEKEMRTAFNMGIGMILAVSEENKEEVMHATGANEIGQIVRGKGVSYEGD
ncbi:phosphoribosylformylglycinamidine cyclo-ligase [Candidatus Woesearchaeota archaeon]|nr:phosphoribosylformylglycinamidine cyclo-ligase [Candidatus Woesearchaeota archaeon]